MSDKENSKDWSWSRRWKAGDMHQIAELILTWQWVLNIKAMLHKGVKQAFVIMC